MEPTTSPPSPSQGGESQPPSASPTNSHAFGIYWDVCFLLEFKKKKRLYQDANLQKYMHDNSLPHFRDHIEDDGSGPDTWSSAV